MAGPSEYIVQEYSTTNLVDDDSNINREIVGSQVGSNLTPHISERDRVFSYNANTVKYELVKFLIASKLPLRSAEDELFEKLMQSFNPQFTKVPINICTNYAIKMFKKEKEILKNIFQNIPGKISLTLDLWIYEIFEYISIAAHYIDTDWVMNKRIIAFSMIEFPRNDHNIVSIVMEILKEYNILNKIISITLDHISTSNDVVDLMKTMLPLNISESLFHNKSFCDVLDLAVRDSLSFIKPIINCIREIMAHIFMSPSQKQLFSQICKRHNKRAKKIRIYVRMEKWNYTYEMLNEALQFKDVINEFCARHLQEHILNDENWQLLAIIRDFLEVFYDAIIFFSGVYYPTSTLALNHFYEISLVFQKYRSIPIFAEICTVMETKFRQYWREAPLTICLVAILDPRLKLGGVKILLEEINNIMETPNLNDIDNIKTNLESLFKEYSIQMGRTMDYPPLQLQGRRGAAWSFLTRNLHKSSNQVMSELMVYLETSPIDVSIEEDVSNFDLLAWWKASENVFPVLSTMARDLLTIQVSTVSLESAFNVDDEHKIDNYKKWLSEETIEYYICLRDWLLAEKRRQQMMEEEDFEEEFIVEEEFIGLEIS